MVHGLTMIDAYVADLDRVLTGPGRAKRDLLAEARDALVDAAESYECRGLPRADAERRAVEDFGCVADIAPDYQAELGLAQTRRTGLLLFLVLVPQAFVWDHAWGLVAQESAIPTHGLFAALDKSMEMFGGVVLAGALLAMLSSGVGVRVLGVRRRLAGVVGRLAFAAAVLISASSLVLAAFTPDVAAPLALRLGWATAFVVVPLGAVMVSARRCVCYA